MDFQAAIRRSCSTPALASSIVGFADPPGASRGKSPHGGSLQAPAACGSGLEVYVLGRPFYRAPFLRRVPLCVRSTFTNMGVCHYLTAFRTPDGQFHVFDFGPRGGDVHLGFPRRIEHEVKPRVWLLPFRLGLRRQEVQLQEVPSDEIAQVSIADIGPQNGRGTAGEVRERLWETLPPINMYVGRTSLTLQDIRDYNVLQNSLCAPFLHACAADTPADTPVVRSDLLDCADLF